MRSLEPGVFQSICKRHIHAAACTRTTAEFSSIVWTDRLCSSIQRGTDIWVVTPFCLLRITLLWTLMYKFLPGHMFWFLWGRDLRVELLGRMVTMSDLLRNCQNVFQDGHVILHSSQQCTSLLISPFLPTLVIVCFLTTALLVGERWYLTVVLVCVSLMANGVGHLSCVYCLFASLP